MNLNFATAALVLLGIASAASEPWLDARDLPEGWEIVEDFDVPPDQRNAIGKNLGGELIDLRNTALRARGQTFKVNKVTCATSADADAVEAWFLKNKPNPRLVVRRGDATYEFVGKDIHLLLDARYQLCIQPKKLTYKVSFDAAPIATCDYMAWNRMYNLFLQNDSSGIAALAPKFDFNHDLGFREFGLGPVATAWNFQPPPTKTAAGGDLLLFRFDALPKKSGLEVVSVSGRITCETGAITPVANLANRQQLLAATLSWPVDDPEIKRVANEITAGAKDDRAKVEALMIWFHPSQGNLRFSGEIVGSRYGVAKVLDQKFGHCWDFSDVFVTLARASGIPARQVAGWLHGVSGHVWAEVYLEGERGWKQVDPSSAMGCGSDYIPFVSSPDGELPMVYASPVSIEVVD